MTAETTLPPVAVTGSVTVHGRTRNEAADFGAYSNYTVAATQAAQQILPYDENRKIAYVLCSGTGPVYIGSQAQAQASPPLGFLLPTGITLTVTNKQALWLVPDGTHTATVSVAIERWTSPLLSDALPGVPGVSED